MATYSINSLKATRCLPLVVAVLLLSLIISTTTNNCCLSIMMKPTNSKLVAAAEMVDFAHDSMEAKVSEATAQFGLNFLNNLQTSIKENVVISPLSLQNVMNMLLLGSSDNSTSQKELIKILNYGDGTNVPISTDRLKPHEAMRSVFQNILTAIHLPSPSANVNQELLNANSGSLQEHHDMKKDTKTTDSTGNKLTAHLQTSSTNKDGSFSEFTDQIQFNLANLILTNTDKIKLKSDYEKDLKTYYNINVEEFSKVENVSSKGAPIVPLHQRINDWVKNQTQNQIEKLVEESDLKEDDIIVALLNAAHFKGRWLRTFNKKASIERLFYNQGMASKDASQVMFMRQKGEFGYADFGYNSNSMFDEDSFKSTNDDPETLLTEDGIKKTVSPPAAANASITTTPAAISTTTTTTTTTTANSSSTTTRGSAPTMELSKEEARRLELTTKLNCSVLMLPFSLNDGQELSMILLLPEKRDGIEKLQAALDGQILNEIYKSLSEQQVHVEIPKFSFEASIKAKPTLNKMGLKSVFENAQLDRMYQLQGNTSGPVYVDQVIHKAKISVDEAGAEASAATMVSVNLRTFIRPPTPTFSADHPFLFIIRHNRSNMPLFMGRVSKL